MMTLADVVEVVRRPDRLDALLAIHGPRAVVDELRVEGIAAYMAWLRPDVAVLADDRRRAVLEASLHEVAVHRTSAALVAAGVTPLVFKGAALACTDYPEPWCRTHLDVDLLVHPNDRVKAFRVLEGLGYRPAGRIPGEIVSGQEVFERVMAEGLRSSIDLHWRLSNRVWLSSVLPAEEVLARGVPAPFAGAGVLRACDSDALLIACLHPIAHHAKAAPLKWVLDVALLARRFRGPDVEDVTDRVARAGASALVAEALDEAAAITTDADEVPLLTRDVIAALRRTGARDRSRRWLDPGRDQLRDAWDDLRALPSWRARARLVREHLCPPAAFMLADAGTRNRAALPWLYVSRIVAGGARWIWRWGRDRWVSRRAK